MNEAGTFEEFRRARKTMWRTRWVLVGLGAMLAGVLLLSGAVLIGAIVGVMTIVRAVLILQWQRRLPWHGSGVFRQSPGR
jgi:hypothetical protein